MTTLAVTPSPAPSQLRGALACGQTSAANEPSRHQRQFAAYLRGERGLSENTVSNYLLDVRQFENWLSCHSRTKIERVSRTEIQQYFATILQDGTSARSVRRKLATLRSFYRTLLDDEVIARSPTVGIPMPKIAKALPKVLSESDVDNMVRWIATHKRKRGVAVRDKAILLTLYASGLRESELANLRLPDLDLDGGFIKVWDGKGGKDGIVPMNPRAIAALQEYLGTLRPKLDPHGGSPYVFVSPHRLRAHSSRPCGQLSRQTIFAIVRDAGRAALGKDVSPHMLRHACATALVAGGADIRDVQAILRHSDIDTTQIYTHTDITYLRRTYEQSHPRA